MAKAEQDRIATIAGVNATDRVKLSGADLMQKALLTKAGTSVGAGKDGARLAQLANGSQV